MGSLLDCLEVMNPKLLNSTLVLLYFCTSGAHRRFSSLLGLPGILTRRKDYQENQNQSLFPLCGTCWQSIPASRNSLDMVAPLVDRITVTASPNGIGMMNSSWEPFRQFLIFISPHSSFWWCLFLNSLLREITGLVSLSWLQSFAISCSSPSCHWYFQNICWPLLVACSKLSSRFLSHWEQIQSPRHPL